MFPRRLPLHCLATAGFFLVGALRLGAELAASSPFMPPAGQQVAAPTSSQPLEFRGMSSVGRDMMFSIFDPAKKTGTWVGLNESGYDFAVKKYDSDSDTVTVEHQGRTLSLMMRTPKIASLGTAVAPMPVAIPTPIPAPTAVPNPNPNPNNPVVRNATNVTTAQVAPTEAARLADWTAEIQRRRDARAQGTTAQPAAVQPAAVAQPQPAQGQQQNAQRQQRANGSGQRAR